jgi:Cd2+/Zn2+-exporting ATPase
MTLLVVGSPCALVISTPAAVLSAIANGARNGVLIKGGAVLDRVGTLNAIAFDKTGTLTVGAPRLLALRTVSPHSESDLLSAASGVEALSEHHLARAVLASATERDIQIPPVTDFRAIPGEGVEGRIALVEVGSTMAVSPSSGDVNIPLIWVGNEVMATRYSAGIAPDLAEWVATERSKGRSTVLVGAAQHAMGAMSFGDQLRPGAAETIRRLKEVHGIRRVTILSGDHPGAVEAIARELGADEVRAGLLPEQKVEALRAMANESLQVAMVGDGVNDAPAMAASSVGVAMGAVGTDVAIETADVVLMGDEIPKVEYLLALGRNSHRIVRQNVFFSVGWMGILVVVASTVGLPLTVAVVAHEGSTILVVLNGLRLLRKL